MTNRCSSALRRFTLPAFIALIAITAALWAGQPPRPAEGAITDLRVGIDLGTTSGASATYNINSLPAFENCLDIRTSVNTGIFYIDVFILNASNLIAFNTDITFTAGKMTILESDVKKLFTASSSVNNLSRNTTTSTIAVNPAVSDGIFFAGAVDTGSSHTGHGVLSRIKAQGINISGGSVIDFRLNINPALYKGVTLTDATGAHPNSGADGIFDGPFINEVTTITVNRLDAPYDPDNDDVSDECDNCDFVSNANQLNTDGDSMGDACDPDDDNDGILDGSDNCPTVHNPAQNASACLDSDGDGLFDGVDNCPNNTNANQANWDNDTQGDVCDLDDDNDGVNDVSDNCQFVANPTQANWNSNALGDACEDSDLDGWLDAADNCKALANPQQSNNDNDNFGNICDNCPDNANNTQADWNSNFIGDACDHSDADGWLDVVEVFVVTKPDQRCPATTALNDEYPDSWPTDFNDNRQTNLSDIVLFGPTFNKISPNAAYNKRFDLNMSNGVTLSDVVLVGPAFNTTCTYP